MRLLPAKLMRDAVPLIALLLAACGGGGGAANGTAPVPVAAYSVGGTVTGLTPGNSITITNNGTDNLTLSGASGISQTFTFTTKLAYRASYSVALSGVPPQPCTSTYGAGMIAYADNVPGYYLPGVNVFCGQPKPSSTFTSAGTMTAARYNHTATLLPNGKVLVSGGQGSAAAPGSAELYDPTLGTWSSPTNQPSVPRYNHTATLLQNGQVLVSGGQGTAGVPQQFAELYTPTAGTVAGTWTNTGSMNFPRRNHTATLLPSGKVLVSGGYNGTASLPSAELYDPASHLWTQTGSMHIPRESHTATLLPSGKVLVSGGYNRGVAGGPQQSAELYDPVSGTWAYTGPMTIARQQHTATLLPSGKVLVSGGLGVGPSILNSAELYDPATGTWTTIACNLNTARYNHTATLLPNGQVLVSGGEASNLGAATLSAELYDPAAACSGTPSYWTNTGALNTARYNHTATLLQNGKVLVSGGQGTAGAINTAELYY